MSNIDQFAQAKLELQSATAKCSEMRKKLKDLEEQCLAELGDAKSFSWNPDDDSHVQEFGEEVKFRVRESNYFSSPTKAEVLKHANKFFNDFSTTEESFDYDIDLLTERLVEYIWANRRSNPRRAIELDRPRKNNSNKQKDNPVEVLAKRKSKRKRK